jgi:molecular chaperone GrpE
VAPFDDEKEREVADDETVTSREESGEPSGDLEEGNEAEIEDATERPDSVEEQSEGGGDDPAAQLQRERDEYLDLAKRAQADFENYRKRAAKEAVAASQRAKSGLVRELLPVVDNLERALASASDSDAAIAEGVRLVHADLVGVLERNGIVAEEPTGQKFDPTEHEAVSMRTEDGAEPGIVLDVVEKGYKLNDTVIRPARVVVSG